MRPLTGCLRTWYHRPPSMKRALLFLLWFVVSLALAALSAWIISTHFAPRPFVSAFWMCLLWTVLANLLFFTFDVLEGAVIFLPCLLVAVCTIPMGSRLGLPALPYIALTALSAGFLSSRILYAALFSKDRPTAPTL
jgi:hypothetical protein